MQMLQSGFVLKKTKLIIMKMKNTIMKYYKIILIYIYICNSDCEEDDKPLTYIQMNIYVNFIYIPLFRHNDAF